MINKKIFFLQVAALLLLANSGCIERPYIEKKHNITEDEFANLRYSMVWQQLELRGIRDMKVLDAMRTVPRHQFVPEQIVNLAYLDQALPIGENQTISQPYIVAYMTELLELTETDRVLEIGTGSGYQAAVLSSLCKEVYSVEILETLAKAASKRLRKLKYNNVMVLKGDGFNGWVDYSPFDAIIVTAAPEEIPPPLLQQLAEGGRMVIPLGPEWEWQELYLIRKENGKIIKKKMMPVAFVPMTGPGVQSINNKNDE